MSRRHTLSASLTAAAVLLAGGGGALRLSAAPRPAAVLAAEQNPPKEPGLRAAREDERKAAIAAIEGQLKAFKADDYAKAEKYQASDLRQNFQSTEHFRRMMREVYPQFANYKSATFG